MPLGAGSGGMGQLEAVPALRCALAGKRAPNVFCFGSDPQSGDPVQRMDNCISLQRGEMCWYGNTAQPLILKTQM